MFSFLYGFILILLAYVNSALEGHTDLLEGQLLVGRSEVVLHSSNFFDPERTLIVSVSYALPEGNNVDLSPPCSLLSATLINNSSIVLKRGAGSGCSALDVGVQLMIFSVDSGTTVYRQSSLDWLTVDDSTSPVSIPLLNYTGAGTSMKYTLLFTTYRTRCAGAKAPEKDCSFSCCWGDSVFARSRLAPDGAVVELRSGARTAYVQLWVELQLVSFQSKDISTTGVIRYNDLLSLSPDSVQAAVGILLPGDGSVLSICSYSTRSASPDRFGWAPPSLSSHLVVSEVVADKNRLMVQRMVSSAAVRIDVDCQVLRFSVESEVRVEHFSANVPENVSSVDAYLTSPTLFPRRQSAWISPGVGGAFAGRVRAHNDQNHPGGAFFASHLSYTQPRQSLQFHRRGNHGQAVVPFQLMQLVSDLPPTPAPPTASPTPIIYTDAPSGIPTLPPLQPTFWPTSRPTPPFDTRLVVQTRPAATSLFSTAQEFIVEEPNRGVDIAFLVIGSLVVLLFIAVVVMVILYFCAGRGSRRRKRPMLSHQPPPLGLSHRGAGKGQLSHSSSVNSFRETEPDTVVFDTLDTVVLTPRRLASKSSTRRPASPRSSHRPGSPRQQQQRSSSSRQLPHRLASRRITISERESDSIGINDV